ncbi:hypothetical protein NSQ91_09140 [Paenibacillus sp. FSL R7-0048]|uniref:hypothetical protein n=1 Tax=Paenibacillus TaxID=44249 RepID=UPI00096D0F47|nr:hypothetical protein [Paenibacillus odorifer]OMD73380.1 hypothetical protein BSK48_05820 [Paenibacillus odorifer]
MEYKKEPDYELVQFNEDVIQGHFDFSINEEHVKVAPLNSSPLVSFPIAKTLVTGAICTMVFFSGSNNVQNGTNASSISSSSLAPTFTNGSNNSSWVSRNRKNDLDIFMNFIYTGSTDGKDFLTIDKDAAYIVEGSEDIGRAEQMLQKIIENREIVEKQGIYAGSILSLLLIFMTLVVPSITWNATIPGTILSISLTGFMYLRRFSRR